MKFCSSWRMIGALGLPEDQPLADVLVDGEQADALADHAVVALLRLVELLEVRVELFLSKKAVP